MLERLAVSVFVLAQILNPRGPQIRDEGAVQGHAYAIDCTGAGLTCSVASGVATFNAAGGGAPTTAQYWVGAADGGLSAEHNLGAFSGVILNTAGTPSQFSAAPGADDQVLVSNGTTTGTWRAMPNCGEAGTLNYDTATNLFSCLTDSGGGGGGLDHPNVMSRASLTF